MYILLLSFITTVYIYFSIYYLFIILLYVVLLRMASGSLTLQILHVLVYVNMILKIPLQIANFPKHCFFFLFITITCVIRFTISNFSGIRTSAPIVQIRPRATIITIRINSRRSLFPPAIEWKIRLGRSSGTPLPKDLLFPRTFALRGF